MSFSDEPVPGEPRLGLAIILDRDPFPRPRETSEESEASTLGLAGVGAGMAPDVDGEAIEA